MAAHWPGPAGIVAAGVLLATALVATSATLVPDEPQRMALPTAGELVELEPYLDPADTDSPDMAGVPETVLVRGDPFRVGSARWAGWDGTAGQNGAAGPGAAAGGQGPGSRPGARSPRPARWTLSAVMIAGDRRIAIINDRMVRPGDRLDDGTRVEVVGSNHVVIITPDGERRRLELEG